MLLQMKTNAAVAKRLKMPAPGCNFMSGLGPIRVFHDIAAFPSLRLACITQRPTILVPEVARSQAAEI
jgi:hypothetical protein